MATATPPNSTAAPPPPPPMPTYSPEEWAALPHDHGGMHLLLAIWIMAAVSVVFLGSRCYCKFLRHRGLWWDDGILIASWICLTIETALLTYAVTIGYGYHFWDMPIEAWMTFPEMLRIINVAGTFSVVASVWSKTSFAITLLRLTEGWTKNLIWVIIVTMNIAMGLSALLIWVQCTPIAKSWDFMIPGTCWRPEVLVYYDIFSAAYSAAMDMALAILPWKLLWGLQMKNKEKVGVAVAMSCGVFAGVTSIVKTTKIPNMLHQDFYDGIELFIWGNAESSVTIVAASIPILRVLIRDVTVSYRKHYASNAAAQQHQQSRSRHVMRGSKNNTVIVTSSGHRSSAHRTKDDGSSEKSILDDSWTAASPGKIIRTHDVVVEYQDRKEGESDDYEMDHLPA